MTSLSVLRHALVPVSDAADHPSPEFEIYCRVRSRQLSQLGLMCAVVTMIVLGATDPIVFRDSPETLVRVLTFRALLAGFCAVMYVVMGRLGDRPSVIPVATGTYLLLLASGFGFMGTLGGPERPFIFSAFMLPFFPVLFRVGFGTRAAITAAGIAAMLLSFYGPHPTYWRDPNNAFLLGFLSCIAVGAVIAADAFYRLERVAFNQRLEMERHAARLAELNRLKDSFLATVSHELRTPLTAITGLVDVLQEEPSDPQGPFYLKTISQAADSLLTIINDILDLAKMKAQKLVLRPAATDVSAVVDQVLAVLGVEARRKALSLTASVPPGLPLLVLDGHRLNQILINLVGNALKFTTRGGARIVVLREGSTLTLRVEDTGSGIDPAKLETVFAEFEQLDSSSTRRFGGTGLGLSIVRHLAGLMGGTAHAEANVPEGCVFVVRLPAIVAEVAASPVAAPSAPVSREVPELLLAEDTPETRTTIEAYGRQAGVRVDSARNGEEALWKFASGAYDLVLLDIAMPEKDGYAAAQGIRALERERGLRPVPVVALSAQAGADYADRAREAGFSWHLYKPFRREDFHQLLERSGVPYKREQGLG